MATDRFDGQAALVTGAATGIGYEVARRIVEEGGSVALVDINGARAQESAARLGGRAVGLAADVADEPSIAGAVAEAARRFGRLDVLVNSAGITGPNVPLESYGADDWRRVMDVNINGTFFACKAAVPMMRRGGYGRIVNIASVNGQTGQFGQTNYSAAKAAIHGFGMALAREVARKGVTVNSVSPGYCRTAMVMAIPQAVREQIVADIPVGRLGEPHEIARVVSFLAAEDAGFITGANIPVNGGYFMDF